MCCDDTVAVLTGHALLHHLEYITKNERPQFGHKRHVTADLDEILCAIDGHREKLDHRDDIVKQSFSFGRQAQGEGGDEGDGRHHRCSGDDIDTRAGDRLAKVISLTHDAVQGGLEAVRLGGEGGREGDKS
jgi:hypothetical protein